MSWVGVGLFMLWTSQLFYVSNAREHGNKTIREDHYLNCTYSRWLSRTVLVGSILAACVDTNWLYRLIFAALALAALYYYRRVLYYRGVVLRVGDDAREQARKAGNLKQEEVYTRLVERTSV